MPAQRKIDAVAELREKFQGAEALILADYRGLTVAEIGELRDSCREMGVELRVVKNRLARLALREASLPALDDQLIGPTAVAIGVDDPIAPAKALSEFAKKNKKLQIKGGLFEGEVRDLSAVRALAALPSRGEMITRLAGSLSSPMRGVAVAIGAITGGFARALRALADQRAA